MAGDNGSGKSTLIEAIAEAMGFADEGGELERSGELPAVTRPVLGGGLVPVLSRTRPRNGYFLSAESFFNVAHFIDSGDAVRARPLALRRVPLHQQSHGQSFLSLAAKRFAGEGLYLLDEPEAALSPTGALALLAIIDLAARAGAQFLIATHSPILLACPEARIYALDDPGSRVRVRRPRGRPVDPGFSPGARTLHPRRTRRPGRLTTTGAGARRPRQTELRNPRKGEGLRGGDTGPNQ